MGPIQGKLGVKVDTIIVYFGHFIPMRIVYEVECDGYITIHVVNAIPEKLAMLHAKYLQVAMRLSQCRLQAINFGFHTDANASFISWLASRRSSQILNPYSAVPHPLDEQLLQGGLHHDHGRSQCVTISEDLVVH